MNKLIRYKVTVKVHALMYAGVDFFYMAENPFHAMEQCENEIGDGYDDWTVEDICHVTVSEC